MAFDSKSLKVGDRVTFWRFPHQKQIERDYPENAKDYAKMRKALGRNGTIKKLIMKF